MARNTERRFAFASKALPQDALEVVSFTGTEALSELYAFDLVLASRRDDLDLDEVIGAPAVLTINGKLGRHVRGGVVSAFALTGKTDDLAFYRASLVPKAHLAALVENARIFLDKTPVECVTGTFQAAGLVQGVDFEFRLTGSGPSRPFVTQYRETDFAFASRWMERDGLYFFFEQPESGPKMVITDSKSAHQPLKGASELRYETPSGLVEDEDREGVFDFVQRFSPVPKSVMLLDYYYETPSAELRAEAPVASDGVGTMRLYGDHFRSVNEGKALAGIRAEEFLCRREVCEGASAFAGVSPGYLMRLTNHFQDAVNREYLIVSARHEGRQFGFLTAGLGLSHKPDGAPETFYRNAFTAIPSSVQFRPARVTPWPRMEGLMNAKIDGEGGGQYPEVDGQGRYKIITAYDLSGRKDGKASKWTRMAQPYGGDGHGMHFPLHKGCEVLYACEDGDPDRPVILGAAPNPDNKSVVTSENQTRTNLETSGKNQLYFEDKEGSERALVQAKSVNAFMRIGTPNDPPSWYEKDTNEGETGITIKTPDALSVMCGANLSTYMIGYMETILGVLQESYLITESTLDAGLVQNLTGHKFKVTGSESEVGFVADRLNGSEQQIAANKTLLADELIAARGRITTLDGEVNTLRQEMDRLSGDCQRLEGQVTRLAQQKTRLSGAVSKLAQQKTDLIQINSTLAGEVQEMAESKIALHTQVTELSTQVDELIETNTTLAEERTQAFTSVTTEAAEMSHICGFDLVM